MSKEKLIATEKTKSTKTASKKESTKGTKNESKPAREKLLLAYSGGLDTSVLLKWLTQKGYDVICFAADVGQHEDFEALKKKAMATGAIKCVVSDLKKEFVKDFIFPAIQFNALYEGRYMLGTSLARPLIAKEMVRVAKANGTNIIAHGATGKGNDQVRFELTAYALEPKIKIIAPWRDAEFNSVFKGRKEMIEFAEKNNIPIKATLKKPWSSDENLLHISFEAGMLEDPAVRPDDDMFELSVAPEKAPDKVTKISIEFAQGVPIALNEKKLAPLALINELNKIGGENGIGRIDIVESRFVGMKSRGVYETPGGTILMNAHRDLETMCLDRDVIRMKDTLMPRFAALIYNGFWYSSEMDCLFAMLNESQKFVTGTVTIELYKGNVRIVGRTSPVSLYDNDIASMDDDGGAYTQSDATGFIRLNALPLRINAKRQKRSL